MRTLPILLLLGALLAAVPVPALAQLADGTTETPALKLERWDAEATLIEQLLIEGTPGSGEIEGMRATLEAQLAGIDELHALAATVLAPLRQQLDALGAAPEDPAVEAPVVTTNRERLKARIAEADAVLRRSDRADARAEALLAHISTLRRELFTRKLLTRGPGLLDSWVPGRAIESIGRVTAAIFDETAARIAQSPKDAPFFFRLFSTLFLIGVALFVVLRTKQVALRRLVRAGKVGPAPKSNIIVGTGVTLVRLLMPAAALAMALFAVRHSGLVGPLGEGLLRGFALTAGIVIGAYAIGGIFFSPHAPQLRISKLPGADAVAAHRWLMALAAVVGLDRVIVVHGEASGLTIAALTLANIILLVLGAIAVWGFAAQIHKRAEVPSETERPSSGEEDEEEATAPAERPETNIVPVLVAGARIVARLSAIFAPILALMGYFAASRFVFYPVVFSGAVIGVNILLFYLVQECVDRIVAPEGSGEVAERSRIRLIPFVVGFLLICAAAPVLALIWGADTADLSNAWRAIADGIHIGDVVISPLEIVSFVLIFSIGYVLTRAIQGVLTRSVLPVTNLDTGGQAAVRAGVGYVGITLAALVAISATGLDLSNLAIVAGALSVGIGFGLQNVVNNFVSGLILLIERPIKEGDWIELASGMGYVKKVNVRSTEIQTFDRASLIVPNSELISGPVTNWTHTNLNGRLKVPVGVAYGTDPRKVETILTEIAKAQPMLLRRPAPYVLFRRFGADALEFELRGVLRDVNWILNVTSDINFEIVRRFADAGIEIPFAQRDLHLKNAGEIGRSIGSALRGDREPPQETPKPRTSRRRPSGSSEAAGNEPDGDT